MKENTYCTADRTITITCTTDGELRDIELRGNLSPTRLSHELCRLHAKAMPARQKTYNSRRIDITMAQLSEPPIPALTQLYDALRESMATLKEASNNLQSHASEGENDAVLVTISGYGCLTSVTCKEDAKTLSAQALAESIMDAYQRAKTMTLSYSQQWDKELTESLEKINPIRVTQS